MIKWYYIKKQYSRPEDELVGVSIVQNGAKTRVSLTNEQYDNITKSRIIFGVDGKRMYFAESPNGYKPVEHQARKAFSASPVLKEFTGQHPLFYDPELKLYYITTDNLE